MKNLGKQIQTSLAKKQKTFYQIFILFLKSSSNLQHCEKKDDCRSLSISEISNSKRGGT